MMRWSRKVILLFKREGGIYAKGRIFQAEDTEKIQDVSTTLGVSGRKKERWWVQKSLNLRVRERLLNSG